MNASRLSLVQAKILLRLWDSPDGMGFADGRDEGGSIKELAKKELVEASGMVGRRIRWRLVKSKLGERDINSLRKLLSNDYSNFQIESWSDGFKIVPGTLTASSSFIVKKDGFACGFAFAMGMLDRMAYSHIKDEDINNQIQKIMQTKIDSRELINLEEYTFEFRTGQFLEVQNPKWWKKSSA